MFSENRTAWIGIVLLLIVIVVLVGSVSLVVNTNCQNDFWNNLLVYPGAERVDEQSQFLGVQRAVYHTADGEGGVADWYNQKSREQLQGIVSSSNIKAPLISNWTVEQDTQRGGSTITFTTMCP